MSQSHRLPEGGRVDRGAPIEFTFNNETYQGYRGDTLASALLANGVHLVARSFKYHRPRGIVAAGSEEPNALIQLDEGARTAPNLLATQTELYDGLVAKSVNCWPSVDFDLRAATGLISRFLPPGFYYKTFMWPRKLWPLYEHQLRKAGGYGVSPEEPDPDRYDKHNAHCDVLVVGGGPAGLAAALEAGRSGARVILADEQNEFGGSLLGTTDTIDDAPAMKWVTSALQELAGMDEVRLLPHSTVAGYFDHNFLTILERVADHSDSADQDFLFWVPIAGNESLPDVANQVARTPVHVGVNRGHEGGEQTRHEQSFQTNGEEARNHLGVGVFVVGEIRQEHERDKGSHDDRPGFDEPEWCLPRTSKGFVRVRTSRGERENWAKRGAFC